MQTDGIIAVTIPEAVRLSGLGKSSLYRAINRDELKVRRFGRRTLILTADLRCWIEGLPSGLSTKATFIDQLKT